jgi:hypothetical protein
VDYNDYSNADFTLTWATLSPNQDWIDTDSWTGTLQLDQHSVLPP